MADRADPEDTQERAAIATATAEPARVFISYASTDAVVANALVESLERHGIPCWIAPRDVRAGAVYADAIVRAISAAKALVLVLSESAIASSHVGKEVERASSKKRPIIALRIDKAPLNPAFEYFLSESHWVEFQGETRNSAFARLIEAVRQFERTAPGGDPTPTTPAGSALTVGPKNRKKRILLAAGLTVAAGAVAVLLAGKFSPAKHVTAEQTAGAAANVVSDRSIAVLPFETLGGSSENGYFADGMTDDIITDLSKLSGILVIARNSSWTYKGKSVKVQQVAEDLGVRYVLEGSVRREGDTVRINAQLVDARGGQHLWAERYDGSIQDVFALQDEVIRQIVAALAINLTRDEQTRLELAETRSPQAYDAVLRGWALYREGSEDETNKAIALFAQAIALDPEYGRAHAAVAAASWRIVQSYWESTTQGGYQRSFDRMQAALANAMRQPNALAHAVSAEFFSKQGRYADAFTELDRAMALAPSDANNYLSKARVLNATGRAAEAEVSVRWAMRLDPLYSPEYLRSLAMSLFNQQRYEEALGTLERLVALKTDVPDDYITLIASLGHLGRKSGVPEAIKTFNELAVAAGYNSITVEMYGAWWWYGDMFNYDPAYRDRLIEGLRKAGVPEGAGIDIPFEKYRRLLHKSGAYYDVAGATTIDLKQAKTLHDRGVKFVDVRPAKPYVSGHVPGAFNLDVTTELTRDSLSRIVGKNEEFVLSCHGKTCPDSAYASAKAVMWGFKRVYYFSAGFPAWQEAGYPVEASPAK
jgi:adenylate cyclase